ncbi:NADP-dependent oxidoreductase [Oryzicola mucosus]|uniref:NADP-dependent oxidoreductase n=1 Tax=Oryzicola mucosus TaxID=2767425 RepID=A0A8J6TW99_9HYPH|nr:NADP-dependent oxidoreductase [Oryzicola mucosus]MBD0413201.1 NADP-dependent oxidoreductase [Oryzicola mucosus]
MSDTKNLRVLLAKRPQGAPTAEHFRFEETQLPEPSEGQVLLKILYLSLDPYMRGRMSDAKSYAKPVELGDVMEGGTVAEVVESRSEAFKPGDIVLSHSGWQSFAVADAKGLRKLDPATVPVTTALGIMGMPGFTAYSGLLTIGQPKPGETVAVAAASGAVGSAVGQIARIKGARAVGIAGGPEKCAFMRDELGFDAVVDHKAADFAERLAAACPDGIDVYFENVGGHVWDAVMPLLNEFARVPVCGLIAQYNTPEAKEADRLPALMRSVLTRSLSIRGFIQREFMDQRRQFYTDMSEWIASDRVRYREDIVDGLRNAPEAFKGLLEGRNFGKLIIKVA